MQSTAASVAPLSNRITDVLQIGWYPYLSETQQKRRVPGQKIVGMQVIDAKGALLGNVKDVGIDLSSKELILYVTTKEKTEVEVTGGTIQSIEDVILVSRTGVPPPPSPAPAPVTAPTTTACPKCQATLPARAKFCAKCGHRLA